MKKKYIFNFDSFSKIRISEKRKFIKDFQVKKEIDIVHKQQKINQKKINYSNVHAISLFSGAGGLDLGSVLAGTKVLSSLDFDKDSINTIRQNKIFKDVDSDFDSEDDEDDEFLDDEAPQTVFNLQNENLLKDQLRRNGVSKIIGRLIKFIELAEENITKEKEEIKAAEEKKDALKLKIRQKKFNNNNNNKNNEKNNRRDGEDEILINNDNEDEIELKNMIIPERKTFLDEHFVQCVYGANDALEWFNDYMDKMDNARALLEKLAQEEKEAAEMAKSGKK